MTTPRHARAEEPLVHARQLTLRTARGHAFGPLDLDIPAGTLHLLVGPSGSGRSSALLAVTARLRGVSGRLSVAGIDATTRARRVRAITAIARLGALVAPEPRLRVAQALTERCLLDGVGTGPGELAFARAARLLDVDPDRDQEIAALSALERLLVSVALAAVRPAVLIVVDDLAADLTHAELDRALDALSALAVSGPTVLASALSVPDPAVPTTLLPVTSLPVTPLPDTRSSRGSGPSHTPPQES